MCVLCLKVRSSYVPCFKILNRCLVWVLANVFLILFKFWLMIILLCPPGC
uniref:Uncharacterized protein n=1 Tax=Rhizophora mucronata TaxID=61149 RepID=A0A2P2NXD7_RHIMU